MPRTTALLAATVALLVAACADDGDDAATATTAPEATSTTGADYPLDDTLRLNAIQALGSHNSYHVQAEPALFAALQGFDAALAATLEYTHAPLEEQFDRQGVRQIELDVFADPAGGLYANRAGPPVVGQPRESGEPALDEPGFKVLHVQDIDFATTCLTFVECLTTVREWSRANPGHVPILVLVEVKDDAIPDPGLGFVVPLPVGATELDSLDTEIRSVFDAGDLLTPDDVRGGRDSLEAAVLTDGWPTLGETRGRVLFALDNEDEIRDTYVDGHPGLRGRVLFTSLAAGNAGSRLPEAERPRRRRGDDPPGGARWLRRSHPCRRRHAASAHRRHHHARRRPAQRRTVGQHRLPRARGPIRHGVRRHHPRGHARPVQSGPRPARLHRRRRREPVGPGGRMSTREVHIGDRTVGPGQPVDVIAEAGIEFLSTPFDRQAVDELDELDVLWTDRRRYPSLRGRR